MSDTLIVSYDNGTNFTYDNTKLTFAESEVELKDIETPTDFTDDFSSDANWTYNPAEIEFSGGNAHLKLTDLEVTFNQPFDSDVGFTYDSAKAEFTGGLVRQKDLKPTGSTCWATYTDDIDLNYGGGVLTGTPAGGASIAGNRLDLAHSDLRYVEYNAVDNVTATQQGAIRLRYTPNYSGTPASDKVPFILNNAVSNKNFILIRHQGAGGIQIAIYASDGATIIFTVLGSWSPTSGVTYEFELNWDIDAGETRFFIDGVQFGAMMTGTGIRNVDFTYIRIGTNVGITDPSNFYIEDLIIFNSVQHVANYTPGYTLPEYRYEASNVILPEMEDTNPGTIQDFLEFTTTESNAPRYTLQIGRSGDYLYWSGAAWVVSNNTYAQANDVATFNANVATLPVSGEIYGQFKVLFDNSSTTQMSVSDLNAKMNIQEYFTTNPEMELTSAIVTTIPGNPINAWNSFSALLNIAGSDLIKITLSDDDGVTYKYWDTSAWVVSSGYAESNTATQISSNIALFPKESEGLKVKFYFHSEDGTTTPNADSLTINYDDSIYSTVAQSVLMHSYIFTDGLDGFTESASIPALTGIKYVSIDNGSKKYWSGASWVASDGTYAQANTAAEIQTNKATLIASGTTLKFDALLKSDDGSVTPTLTSISILFDNYFPAPSIGKCLIYGNVMSLEGAGDVTTEVRFYVNEPFFHYTHNTLIAIDDVVTTDGDGYFEIEIVETVTSGKFVYCEVTYSYDGGMVTKELGQFFVPNTGSIDFESLIGEIN